MQRTVSILSVLIAVIYAGTAGAQPVIITELCNDPAGYESDIDGGRSHEFFEIMNLGGDTLFSAGLYFSDGDEIDAIVPWEGALPFGQCAVTGTGALPPGGIGLVLDRDYARSSRERLLTIDSSAVIFTTEDSDLGNGLQGTDGLVLFAGTESDADSILFAVTDAGWDSTTFTGNAFTLPFDFTAPEGCSYVLDRFLFTPHRYAVCPGGLSPGRYEHLDGPWVVEWKLGPLLDGGGAVRCSLGIIRAGGPSAEAVSLRIDRYIDGSRRTVYTHPPFTTAGTRFGVCSLDLDTVRYVVLLQDGGLSVRDTVDITTVWTPPRACVITELFPRATATEPEWFELHNRGPLIVSVDGWHAGNREDSVSLGKSGLRIRPGDFLVVTKDSTCLTKRYPALTTVFQPPGWHTLTNYTDTLTITTAAGQRLDTIAWSSAWFDSWNNESLERVSTDAPGCAPRSWALAALPTPGRPNGAFHWRNVSAGDLSIGPCPFSPDGDGVDERLVIRLKLPGATTARVRILGFDGAVSRTFDPAMEEQFWDGRDEEGHPVQRGPFFVIARFTSDVYGTSVVRKKGILWH